MKKTVLYLVLFWVLMLNYSCNGQQKDYGIKKEKKKVTYISDSLKEGESFYENGTKHLDIYFDQNGKMNGKYIEYWPNGNKEVEFNYYHDIREGKQLMWFKNGHLSTMRNYKNGVLDGEVLELDEDSGVIAHEIYSDGKMIKDLNIANFRREEKNQIINDFIETGLDSSDAIKNANEEIRLRDSIEKATPQKK